MRRSLVIVLSLALAPIGASGAGSCALVEDPAGDVSDPAGIHAALDLIALTVEEGAAESRYRIDVLDLTPGGPGPTSGQRWEIAFPDPGGAGTDRIVVARNALSAAATYFSDTVSPAPLHVAFDGEGNSIEVIVPKRPTTIQDGDALLLSLRTYDALDRPLVHGDIAETVPYTAGSCA